jgi:hypothetical protein
VSEMAVATFLQAKARARAAACAYVRLQDEAAEAAARS